MRILVFDTETTGFPLWKDPSDHPAQPHLVELALGAYDEHGTELFADSWIAKPDGWRITPELTAIHNIANDHALEVGIPESVLAQHFAGMIDKADVVVAHNLPFDRRIMRIALLRAGYPRTQIEAYERVTGFDTCNRSTALVKAPPSEKMLAYGMRWSKSPKLAECIEAFFGETMEGAHDGLFDMRACARVFFHLVNRQVINLGALRPAMET
jgi:DNA polymerase III subunit epsilon